MTEDQLEQEALGWLADVGYQHRYGPDLAPDGSAPERRDYRQVLLVERQAPGGQAGNSPKIENYLGFPSGLSGSELTRRAVRTVETAAEKAQIEKIADDVAGKGNVTSQLEVKE